MNLQRFILTVILFSITCSCSSDDKLKMQDAKAEVRKNFPDVEHITIARFKQFIDDKQDFVLLDTRSKEEYSVSCIKDAKLMYFDKLPDDKDTKIIVYCSVGYRSAAAAHKLKRQGYKNVYNLEGSIFEWANKGNPVYKGDKQVKKVHPYNKKWGELLDEKYHSYK